MSDIYHTEALSRLKKLAAELDKVQRAVEITVVAIESAQHSISSAKSVVVLRLVAATSVPLPDLLEKSRER